MNNTNRKYLIEISQYFHLKVFADYEMTRKVNLSKIANNNGKECRSHDTFCINYSDVKSFHLIKKFREKKSLPV